MKKLSMIFAALMAAAVITPSAQAQCVATPLQSLVGTWTFSTDQMAVAVSPDIAQGAIVSAGRFTATVSGVRGILSITATSSSNSSVTRQEQDAGTFQVDDNCAGGTLTFNLSSRPVQYEFYFVNPNEIAIVGNNHNGGDVVIGSARRVQEQVCPVPPLQILSGAWVFSTTGFDNRNFVLLSAAGRMTASVGTDRAGNPLGVLALNVTSSIGGSPVRRESDAGRFQVNADCSGGTLTFNLSSRPVQFDFFFTSNSHLVMVGTNQGDAIVGSARRVDPATGIVCPADPLQALAGTWAFSNTPFSTTLTRAGQTLLALAGRFTASSNGSRGLLAITASSATAFNGGDFSGTRLETDAGSFQVDADCAGGTLTFNLSSRPIQYEYHFVNADEIVIVGNYGNTGEIMVGTARRVVPQVCPAQPLQALAGDWVFSTLGVGAQIRDSYLILGSTGRFSASVGADRAGNPLGLLALNVTSSIDGSPVRRESDAGRFQVNADCSGGTLTFNLSSRPIQFDFFFSSANRLVMIATGQQDVVVGSARRFGTN